jgi:5-(aminomethyl)-3-furanmethanol phosphate kinase
LSDALIVVKLGGSYADSPLLSPWLAAIEAAAGRVVLVPGGGPFADAVRAAQPVMGFGDEAADAMALLAMAQFGLALCDLRTRLVSAESEGAIRAALGRGDVPVWAPLAMVRGEADLPRSWSVTSDSLALWLAQRLGAGALLLVKRRGDGREEGIVDAYFPRLHETCPLPVFVAGPDDLPAAGLDPDRLPGQPLAHDRCLNASCS